MAQPAPKGFDDPAGSSLEQSSNARDQLIDRCRQGDAEALERIFREHAPKLQRVLRRLMEPAADHEDALQDTLIVAARSFKNFRGDSAVETWLIGIAVRVARKHLSQPRLRRSSVLQPEDPDEPDTPDRVALARSLLMRLNAHLQRLNDSQRSALLLHHIEGLSLEETAHAMSSNRLTTKSRLYWARRTLRRALRSDPELRDVLEQFDSGEADD